MACSISALYEYFGGVTQFPVTTTGSFCSLQKSNHWLCDAEHNTIGLPAIASWSKTNPLGASNVKAPGSMKSTSDCDSLNFCTITEGKGTYRSTTSKPSFVSISPINLYQAAPMLKRTLVICLLPYLSERSFVNIPLN